MTITGFNVIFKTSDGQEWSVTLPEEIFNKIKKACRESVEIYVAGYIECLKCETLLLQSGEDENDKN